MSGQQTRAGFVEPMLLLASKPLPEGPNWVYELLCGGPHKISCVAFGVMWRSDAGPAMNKTRNRPRCHIIPIRAFGLREVGFGLIDKPSPQWGSLRFARHLPTSRIMNHSYLSASMGSTFVARHAGKKLASPATPIRITTEAARMPGLAPAIPKRSVFA